MEKSERLGIGIVEMAMTFLTGLFIGLKLGDVIDWSWWWVFSPIWIPFAIFGGVLLIISVYVCLSIKGD